LIAQAYPIIAPEIRGEACRASLLLGGVMAAVFTVAVVKVPWP
jgi:hypothetical protein